MLESVVFKNFKALRNTTLPLAPFTLLLGPNGSGKSTALQAIQGAASHVNLGFPAVASVGVSPGENVAAEVTLKWLDPVPGATTLSRWYSSGQFQHLHRGAGGAALGQDVERQLEEYLTRFRTYWLSGDAIAQPVPIPPNI